MLVAGGRPIHNTGPHFRLQLASGLASETVPEGQADTSDRAPPSPQVVVPSVKETARLLPVWVTVRDTPATMSSAREVITLVLE